MNSPLADRLRPKTLDEVFGQKQLLAPGTVFRRNIEAGRVPNMVFYGPPGVGKTTVARIIAENSGMRPVSYTHLTAPRRGRLLRSPGSRSRSP